MNIVWTIAGSDSGGGAGIQADLKTINQLGAFGASVVTAITAQNTVSVNGIETVSPEMIEEQINALRFDLPPRVIKLGMLYAAKTIASIVATKVLDHTFVICDPVLIATSGDALALPEMKRSLIEKIIPRANLLTPNLEEAYALLGIKAKQFSATDQFSEGDTQVEALAYDLLKLGCQSVLLKGGASSSEFSQDFWTNGKESSWLTSPRIDTRSTHGTGCTLSAAIAAATALGYDELDAVVIAKAYVNQGLRCAPSLGRGQGPMAHLGWPEYEDDLPWLTATAAQGRLRPIFPECGPKRLGFYPIVDSYTWLEKLLPMGVKTAQLRIKNLSGDLLKEEIAKSVALAKDHHCRLFINDYWQLSCDLGAYGVHLGQEDLLTADIQKIHASGLRLGVSTHSYSEVARALAVRPSYLAIGPIHATTTKEMKFAPQGVEALQRWRRSLGSYPLVAIGGIFVENTQPIIEAGADGVAVVRDISQASDLSGKVGQWLSVFPYAFD